MKKYKSAYYKPYIRKIKKSDMSNNNCDLRTAIRLSVAKEVGFKYVLVQRGCGNILDVDTCKENLKRKIFVVRNNREFNIWANDIKNYCKGK